MLLALRHACIAVVLVALALGVASEKAWMRVGLDPAARAQLLLEAMTLEEKVAMCHGGAQDEQWTGNIIGNARLGIPRCHMNDGPQGFADDQHLTTTTAWPSSLTMASTWDVKAMHTWGNAMGEEFYAKGASVQLGPGVNLARVPQNGRNFEYLSGEDPFLGYTLVQPVVRGVQSNGVMSVVKHFVCNNQEVNRRYISANVDERTRFEYYYAPFAGAVDAGVASVMTSYNRINDVWASENKQTIAIDLKQRLGFRGFVMSDWDSMHSMSIGQGLDVEMPFGVFNSDANLLASVRNGTLPEAVVDDAVHRVLTSMFTVGLFDEVNENVRSNNASSAVHVDLARRLSAQATVLLKNAPVPPNAAPLLPLDASDPQLTLALLGWADADWHNGFVVGNGSGEVNPTRVITPLQAMLARFDPARILYQPNVNDTAAAVALAQRASVAIVFVGEQSREGHDRVSLAIRAPGDELIAAVARAQPRTIVVAAAPGAILTPWRESVPAILCNFMPGQEVGNAIVDVLLGEHNPSARLPVTFPVTENDQRFTPQQYPGTPIASPLESDYSEGPFFGYRYYQANGVVPAFAFGHGLSYSQFAYANLSIVDRVATVTVTNIGARRGTEVVQLYLQYPAAAPPPVPRWQLRGFASVDIDAGASVQVHLPLTNDRWLSTWDVQAGAWVLTGGRFQVAVGAASDDIRVRGEFDM